MSVILQKSSKITKNNKNKKNWQMRKKVHMIRKRIRADMKTKYRNKNQKKKVKKKRIQMMMIVIFNRRKRWDYNKMR